MPSTPTVMESWFRLRFCRILSTRAARPAPQSWAARRATTLHTSFTRTLSSHVEPVRPRCCRMERTWRMARRSLREQEQSHVHGPIMTIFRHSFILAQSQQDSENHLWNKSDILRVFHWLVKFLAKEELKLWNIFNSWTFQLFKNKNRMTWNEVWC